MTKVSEAVEFGEVDTFPVADKIPNGALLSLSLKNRTNSYTHGLHRFPAKFVPQVSEWALRSYAFNTSRVLDPFSGSGTTLVEGIRRGHRTVGLEINPLARLISKVKATPLDWRELQKLAGKIADGVSSARGELTVPIGGVANFSHWFKEESWRDLDAIKRELLQTTMSDREREFFLVVFSSIIRRVSNADDQSQKTYVSGTLLKNPPPVMPTWKTAIDKAILGMRDLVESHNALGEVDVPPNGDALDIGCPDGTVDLAITSPPYMDSVDYPYNLMLEHFWLGPELGIPTRNDFNILRRQQLGAKNPEIERSLPPSLRDSLGEVDFHQSRRKSAKSYFAFMDDHLAEMSRVLTPTGKYVMVVGNSRTNNDTVPIHASIAKLAAANGLYLEHKFGYRIRRHYMKFPRAGRGGIILVDWVMTFSKSPHRRTPLSFTLPLVTLGHDEVAN